MESSKVKKGTEVFEEALKWKQWIGNLLTGKSKWKMCPFVMRFHINANAIYVVTSVRPSVHQSVRIPPLFDRILLTSNSSQNPSSHLFFHFICSISFDPDSNSFKPYVIFIFSSDMRTSILAQFLINFNLVFSRTYSAWDYYTVTQIKGNNWDHATDRRKMHIVRESRSNVLQWRIVQPHLPLFDQI